MSRVLRAVAAFALPLLSLPTITLAQDFDDYEEYVESGEVDEFGLPQRTRTQYEREAKASSPTSTVGSGWGATPRDESGASSGWGGRVVDRRQADLTEVPCEIPDDQFDQALRRADLALADGDLERWFDAVLPLAQAGCDRPDLYQRIEQARQTESEANRRRDQQIAAATQWSRSRLRRPGEPFRPSNSPQDWIEVANGLANLGASIRAAREGRPTPPPTTIISQGPDGSIAYNLPPPPPPPSAPDPAVAAELARRVAERRRMEAEAVRATNISSWQKVRTDPNAGIPTTGGSGGPDEAANPPPGSGPASPPPALIAGGSGASPWDPASAENCEPQSRRPGAQCMCRQGLYGIAECSWREGGEEAGDPCGLLLGQGCYGTQATSFPPSCVGNGFAPRAVTWVVEVPRSVDPRLNASEYAVCSSSGQAPQKAGDVPGIDNWRGSLRIVSRHEGKDQADAAARALTAAVAQCNDGVRQRAGQIYEKDLSSCEL